MFYLFLLLSKATACFLALTQAPAAGGVTQRKSSTRLRVHCARIRWRRWNAHLQITTLCSRKNSIYWFKLAVRWNANMATELKTPCGHGDFTTDEHVNIAFMWSLCLKIIRLSIVCKAWAWYWKRLSGWREKSVPVILLKWRSSAVWASI